MKNKGQTLVLFVLLLPLFIVLFAYIFDTAIILVEDHRLEKLGEEAIYMMFDGKNEDEIEDLILTNNKNIEISQLDMDKKIVFLKRDIDSYFGKVIGYDMYHLDAFLQGSFENKKIVIEKKG